VYPWIRFKSLIKNPDFKKFVLVRGPRIQKILTNQDESLVHRCTVNRKNPYESLGFKFTNLYGVKKIRFVDSTQSTVFKRFIL